MSTCGRRSGCEGLEVTGATGAMSMSKNGGAERLTTEGETLMKKKKKR